jgi:hypothetical protein
MKVAKQSSFLSLLPIIASYHCFLSLLIHKVYRYAYLEETRSVVQ